MTSASRLYAAVLLLAIAGTAEPALAYNPFAEKSSLPTTITNTTDAPVRIDLDVDTDFPIYNVRDMTVTTSPDGRVRLTKIIDASSTFAIPLGASSSIFDGNTYQFTLRVYEPGATLPLADHRWLVKLNTSGIQKCRIVQRFDPDQRLTYMHRKLGDGGLSAQELATQLALSQVPGYDLFRAIEAGDVQGAIFAALGEAVTEIGVMLDVYGLLVGVFDRDPNTCLSSFVVHSPTPEHLRNDLHMGMSRGFGGPGYTWAADFDGDGRSELISAIAADVHLARATGPIDQMFRTYSTGSGTWGGAGYNFVGDFDGDGAADVASALAGELLLRQYDSNFVLKRFPVPNLWGAAEYTFKGDFNGDGRDDLASANAGNVYMKLGRPRDALNRPTGFTGATWPVASHWGAAEYTRVGDFDGNGCDDIASAYGAGVYLHRSTCNGFTTSYVSLPGMVWGGGGYTWAGDFNGDGRDDLATAYAGTVRVLLGTNAGGFTLQAWETPNSWGGAGWIRVGDFNGDGRDDIASPYGADTIMRLSTGSGFVTTSWVVPEWTYPDYEWIGDFDGDGRADMANAYELNVQVKRSTGISFGYKTKPVANMAAFAKVRRAGTYPFNVAEYANDGLMRAGWASRTGVVADPWYEVDFIQPVDIGYVMVAPEAALTPGTRVEISTTACSAPTVIASGPVVASALSGEIFSIELVGRGRYVCVRSNPYTALSLREVVVNPARPRNLALGKAATQSSTINNGVAIRATDGDTNGNFHEGSVTHTASDAGAWWQVDLGAVENVGEVVVHNRTDCCGDRLAYFRVRVSADGVNWSAVPYNGYAGRRTVLSIGRAARYVRVELSGTNHLSLAEVEVFEGPLNLALGKPTTQSSTLYGASAARAVDGNNDGVWNNGSVTHTGYDARAWWQVDLGSAQYVDRVDIYNRTDCCADRLSNFAVLTSTDGVNWASTPFAGGASPTTTIPIARNARYVKIQLDGTNYLSLAEVRVLGR